MKEYHTLVRGPWIGAILVLTSLLAACGGGGDAEDGTPTASASGTATATVAVSTKFVQSQDEAGPGVWHLGESLSGLAIGALCTELGGGSKLDVNGGARRAAASVGSRSVAVTRDGMWFLWLSKESAAALPKVAPSAVVNRELTARVEQGLMLGPGDPYLACN